MQEPNHSSLLPRYALDATALADAGQRFELLNDLYASHGVNLAPASGEIEPLGIRIQGWNIADSIYTASESAGHIGRRFFDKNVPYLGIYMYQRGRSSAWGEDFNYAAQTGDIVVTASSRRTIYRLENPKTSMMLVPLDFLGPIIPKFSRPMVYRKGTSINRFLTAAFSMWKELVEGAEVDQATTMERTISSLLMSLLAADPFQDNDDPMLLSVKGRALRTYLDNLDVWDTPNIHHMCREFGLSRASLYREFETDGGVANYVQSQRLRRALWMLESAPMERGQVTKVAEAVGFGDPYHFSRAFRRHFGFAPSDALQLRQLAA